MAWLGNYKNRNIIYVELNSSQMMLPSELPIQDEVNERSQSSGLGEEETLSDEESPKVVAVTSEVSVVPAEPINAADKKKGFWKRLTSLKEKPDADDDSSGSPTIKAGRPKERLPGWG